MAVTIDPASSRVSMVSIPRDLVVRMQLQSNPNRVWINKINAAYEVPYVDIICSVASQYQGRDGGGHAAESVVGTVTGLSFDRYIAVDFVAFRDMVNALGGVDVCLTTNLDDIDYPDYNNWFHPIHFKAGCQHLDGEQAHQFPRPRTALHPHPSPTSRRPPRQQTLIQPIHTIH